MATSVKRRETSTRPARTDGLPTSERVYRELKRRIISGELPPSARLVELNFASEFGVSRTPVREALKRLEAENLALVDPTRGLVVHEPGPSEIEDIYLLREVLDGLASRLAAQRISDEEIARLQMIVDTMREAIGGEHQGTVVNANMAFHDVIYRAAGNQMLSRVARDLRDFVRRFSGEALASADRADEILAEHVAMLDAFRRRDPDAAEKSSNAHMRRARDYVVRLHLKQAVESQSDYFDASRL
jgi:DNA-binding GntR family transcriptional regulator